ncbi:MAG: hypothetical protein KGJ23_15530 [Euryarchaeota archaeon]|nr:hypothetical protein [Euryarchaeota archaeon]MDE1838010.1 hypothetical protein [Euryarchaeota archaeon]MDE1881767.1 hypothetical protein [Euryarchaeota archaeon]MDE2046473.1 hypothetical protein [Thermoplasmata archaeon]
MVACTSCSSGGTGYSIDLNGSLSFLVLLATLALFVAMYLALRANTRSRKALEGFREAVFVDSAFLCFSVVLVIYLAWKYPTGDHVAWALSQVVLGGLWLTFAIPVVTVGFSVHSRTRGQVAWIVPSILVAAGLFVVIYWWTYNYAA